jgi:hypothetical protein
MDELIEVYSYLYPNCEVASGAFLHRNQRLNILRGYHKEQLEKAKIRQFISEYLKEIRE